MTIQIGEKLPSVSFKKFGKDGFSEVSTDDFFASKRVLLFGIPGAFTPVCQGNHVPGYMAHIDSFKQHGIDEVACISINDCFVMKAFGEAQNTDGKIDMLADDAGEFTTKVGLAMVVKDGIVETLKVEKNFVDHNVSSAEQMLAILGTDKALAAE